MQKKLINYSKKKKTITVEELSSMCVEIDNFREEIYCLVEDGTISPVKTSGTDGNLSRPLYKKYRINITEEKTYGRFLFGIGAGLRYEIGKLYIEPKITWGYPFMLAINAAVGYTF